LEREVAKRYLEDWVRKHTSLRYIVEALGMPADVCQSVRRWEVWNGLTGWYQRVSFVRIDWQFSLRINHILTQPIPALHQRVQVVPTRMHFDPPRMVLWRRRIGVSDCFEPALLVDLLVAPYSICPHVCAVEVCFARVEDHTVDGGLVAVLVVLDVFDEVPGVVYGEDITVAGVVVEWVAVYGVWRFPGGEEEDCAGFGGGFVGFGCRCVRRVQ